MSDISTFFKNKSLSSEKVVPEGTARIEELAFAGSDGLEKLIIPDSVTEIGNYAFIIPAYVNMYHMPLEAIIAMGTEIFPIIHDKLSFVLCCVLPFNLIKAAIVDVLTLTLYKRISPLLKRQNKA